MAGQKRGIVKTDIKVMNQKNKEGKKEGYWEGVFSNGNISSKGNYINNMEDGYWEDYHSNGNLYSKGNFIKGKRDGFWEYYYINGNLSSKGNYIKGKRDGCWVENYRPSPHQLYLNI